MSLVYSNENGCVSFLESLLKKKVCCQDVVIQVIEEQDSDGNLSTCSASVKGCAKDVAMIVADIVLCILFDNQLEVSETKSIQHSLFSLSLHRSSQKDYSFSFMTK